MKSLLLVIFLLVSLFAFSQFGEPSIINGSHALSELGRMICFDFDYDGDNDLITATFSGNMLVFMENTDGDSLKSQVIISSNSFASFDTADIDNDGLVDLVAKNEIGVGWYKNHGNNSFNDFHLVVNTVGCGYANDVDMDGDMDIFVAHNENNKISLYKNDGNGNFGSEIVVTTQAVNPFYIQFEDMDNDGDIDLISSSKPQYRIELYRNDGSENFAKTQIHPEEMDFTGFVLPKLVDFNSDGLLDIIYVLGDFIWYQNTGNGTFLGPDFLFISEAYGEVFLLEDMNSDGGLDYAIGTNYYYGEIDIKISGKVAQTIGFTDEESMVINNLIFTDFDNDGHIDIIDAIDNGIIRFFKNDGTDVFLDPLTLNSQSHFPLQTFPLDWDSDSDIDIVEAYRYANKLSLYENLGDNNFSEEQLILDSIPSLDWIPLTGLIDLDNDQDFDLVYKNENGLCIVKNSDNNWTYNLIEESSIYNFKCVDFNFDNYTDILYSTYSTTYLLLNDGLGNFQSPTEILQVGYYDFQISDLDIDGDSDIIAYENDDSLYWFENDGTSENFDEHFIIDLNSSAWQRSILVFDSNLDNLLDIVVKSGFQIFLLRNLGDEIFSEIELVNTNFGPVLFGIDAVDFDSDLDTDILYYSQEGSFWIENINGNYPYQSIPILEDPDLGGVEVADINGDGTPDLISQRENCILLQTNFMNALHISGDIFFDENQNGIREEEEPGFLQTQLNVTPNSLATYSNSEGEYWIAVDPGAYQLSCEVPQFWALSTNPQTYSLTLTENTPQPDTCNFGFYPSEIVNMIEPDLIPAFSICNDAAMFWVNLYNSGTTIPSGVVEVELDAAYTFAYSDIPVDSIVGNSIYFSFDSLPFFQDLNFYFITTAPPASMMGDTVTSFLSVFILDEFGTTLSTLTDSLSEEVTCSYDPNDKNVSPRGIGSENFIEPDQELEYTIRFQNTGNDTAINVIITDPLSINLDQNSFEFVSSSHDVRILRQDRLLTFAFDSIMLPDSNVNAIESNGYVKYKIRPNPSLNPFVEINNTGYIYFDYNDPVITNTALSTIICWISPSVPNISQIEGTLYTDAIGTIQWFLNGEAIEGANSSNFTPTASGIFSVEATNVYGCSQLSEPFNFIYNKIELAYDELAVFPNPAADKLNIITELSGSLIIYSITGKVLLTERFESNTQIDISILMEGTYLVRVEGGNSSSFTKLVVIK